MSYLGPLGETLLALPYRVSGPFSSAGGRLCFYYLFVLHMQFLVY